MYLSSKMAEFEYSPNKNLEKMDCTAAMLEDMQVKLDNKPVKSCYNEVWGGDRALFLMVCMKSSYAYRDHA